MYTITVSRDSRFYWLFNAWLKAYAFSWSFEPTNICRAVWGTLFWPLGFFYRLYGAVGGLATLYLGMIVVAILISDFVLAAFCVGGFLFVSWAHRWSQRRSQLTEEQRKEEAEQFVDRLEDWADPKLTWLEDFYDHHLFISYAVLAAGFVLLYIPARFLIALVQLALVFIRPIVVPLAVGIGNLLKQSTQRIKDENEKAEKEAREREPNPFGEAYQSFHDRTCRKIVVE